MGRGEMTIYGGAIILALLAYTYAVWGEQITGKLKGIFIVSFLTGFTLDVLGTSGMFLNSRNAPAIHGVLGIAALLGMGIHAGWALLVWKKGDEKSAHRFHRYSRYVYILWLCAFFSGPLLMKFS
ncbi:MAG: TIGR03987 family protein [Candidatus Schekmanbacteria bacterium]|nr:TIGR03987 family protein [Candidatus Schekmanbacteria bacterium]